MKILIVEDDRNLSHAIKRCLASSHDSDQAFDGAEGYFLASKGVYDLIILDLMLPALDGYTVLERLREEGVFTPVLILTAKGTLADKARGFRSGGDDYLVKPFHRDELLMRIEAILRRTMGLYETKDLVFKELVISRSRRTVEIAGKPLDLKGKQFDALEYLVSNQDRLISKTQLFDRVWGVSLRNLLERGRRVHERHPQAAEAFRLRHLPQDDPRGRLPVYGKGRA